MKRSRVVAALIFSTLVLACVSFTQSEEIPRITKEEAVKLLGNPDVIIIDVRQEIDWKLNREKIKGAVREDPDKMDAWMQKYPKDKTLIFYCA